MTVQILIWSIFLHASFALAAPSPTLTPTDVADTAFYYNRLINALLALQSSEVSGDSNPSSAFSTFVSVSTAASVSEPSTETYIPLQTNTPATAEKASIVATNVAVTIGDDESAMDLIALSSSCALCLNGAWWNDTCYDNLEDAVHKSSADGVITVRGKITVDKEITIDRDTTVVGENCNGSRAIVTSMINDQQRAAFLMEGKTEPVLSLRGIDFVNGKGFSRLIRSEEKDVKQEEADDKTNSGNPAYSLNLHDISATNFKTKARGGAVIFLQVAKHVDITKCTFFKNTVADPGKEYYGGGGAVNFHELLKDHTVHIEDSSFTDNDMEFEHGLGAAFTIAICNGIVDIISSQFIGNRAADGGAIHISRVGLDSVVSIIDSKFIKNIALEQGWGSRGSALRFKYIAGKVNIDALFDSNVASEGRGVIANNRIQSTGRVEIAGKFENNASKLGGGVWDTHNGHSGVLTIKVGTQFLNSESPGQYSLYFKGIDGTTTQSWSETDLQNLASDLVVGKGDLIETV